MIGWQRFYLLIISFTDCFNGYVEVNAQCYLRWGGQCVVFELLLDVLMDTVASRTSAA